MAHEEEKNEIGRIQSCLCHKRVAKLERCLAIVEKLIGIKHYKPAVCKKKTYAEIVVEEQR